MRSSPIPRPMTPDELTAIEILRGVEFPHGALYDRKLASHLFNAVLVARVANEEPSITQKTACKLWRLIARYRRHVKIPQRAKFIRMAEKLMVPGYRAYEYRKAQEARYKIEAMKREAAQQPNEMV